MGLCARAESCLTPPRKGQVPEWFNGLAWKACNGLNPFEGSNPSLSARFRAMNAAMGMNRRQFISLAGGALALSSFPYPLRAEAADRAPFRLLYSNDLTNLLTCVSPFHRKGEGFRPEMLEASVDEVAGLGVDAHFLQPAKGWVPWWRSKIYPAAEHYRWFEETYGKGPDSCGKYLLGGGDYVQVFIDRCRLRGQAPFISFRLNDGHHLEWVDAKRGEKVDVNAQQALTPFYRDHPEYRLGPDLHDWKQRVLNWAIPEVRERVFSLIQELCENYDLEGLELDYMRYFSFFRAAETTSAQRREIMTAFVGRVRALLDRTARQGKRRWLCARVPAYVAAWDGMGIDLAAMAEAGLDMANLSASYFTVQQTDLPAIRKQVPGVALYDEMTHVTWAGKPVGKGYDSRQDRRTTPEQFYTTAHLAYAEGADGVSLFNFAYYREYGEPYRGPFSEPPFLILPHLRDKAWLARQPQHYFLGPSWKDSGMTLPIPRTVKPGETASFPLDLAPPSGGWVGTGGLRVQGQDSLGESRWEARINGVALNESAERGEPYPNFYTQLLGKPEQLRAWRVPASCLRPGKNVVELFLREARQPLRLYFLDLWASGTA